MNTNLEEQPSDPSRVNMRAFEMSIVKKHMPEYMGEEVVNDIFGEIKKKETYQIKYSSSECRIRSFKQDHDELDPRLKNWNKVLRQRKALQKRIEQHTGKRAEDVLFNRHVTIDEQSKRMLIRLMDTAERSEGIPPHRVKPVLKMRLDTEKCREIRELQLTEPKLKQLEFVGLPEISKLELTGSVEPGDTQWQRSELLGAKLEQQEENIKRVLTHCPDIEQLQVAPGFTPNPIPLEDTMRIGEEFLRNVSKTTSELTVIHEPLEEPKPPVIEVEKVDNESAKMLPNIIRINGCAYGFGDSSGLLTGDLQLFFQCDPYQRMTKTIVEMENIGRKFIIGKWQQVNLHNKELNQHQAINREFVFDCGSFALLPGQRRRIDVMYQPIIVGVKKQRWTLNLQRSPFCGIRRMNIRFHGVCTEPAYYRQRLDMEQNVVITNRKQQLTERLAKMHAELTPIVETTHLSCPYERVLDERELFGAQNPGFKCERFADLETLKELYALVKKPRQPRWDFRIETVRQCIYQHEPKQRESLQNIIVDIIEPMRCNSNEEFTKAESNRERERSCFVFVRGVICSALEEWEVLAETLGDQFYKAELQRYAARVEEGLELTPVDVEYVDRFITKKVNGGKYFRDALYIQTYTILCDAAENIVSAIESTIHV